MLLKDGGDFVPVKTIKTKIMQFLKELFSFLSFLKIKNRLFNRFPLFCLPWLYPLFKFVGVIQTFNLFLYKTRSSENRHLFFLLSFLSLLQQKYRLWVKGAQLCTQFCSFCSSPARVLPCSDLMWQSHHTCIHSNCILGMKQQLLFVQLNDIFHLMGSVAFPFEWIKVAKESTSK